MYRFRKSQRICSLKEMDNLFERGNNSTAQAFPLRAVFRIYTTLQLQKDNIQHSDKEEPSYKVSDAAYKISDAATQDNAPSNTETISSHSKKVSSHSGSIPLKVLISVGKKFFRHAVDRNRAKRQIREAWRLQSQALSLLAQEKHLSIHIAFIWQSNKPMATKTIQGAMHRLLTAIETSITKQQHKL